MDFFDLSLLKEGGLIMWPLLLLSLIGFVLFIERLLYLHKGQIRSTEFLSGIKNLVRKQRIVEALTVCEETPGPVARIVRAALLSYSDTEERMRGSIQSAALVEIPNLERRIGSIAAIARIAPLLGLLGTIVGVLNTFYGMEGQAYPHMGIVALGVKEALITTAVGLVIAIMAGLAHHFLHGRVRALVHDMEWAGNDIMEFLLRDIVYTEEKEDGRVEHVTRAELRVNE